MAHVRYRSDSDEEVCGEAIEHEAKHGPFACWRRRGHEGEHLSMLRNAADADRVCHGCREAVGKPHREDCFAAKDSGER